MKDAKGAIWQRLQWVCFENSGLVDGVVRDLTAKGFLEKDIIATRTGGA
jgi:hypothetical protein